jgi:hypothetical protein
VKVNVKMLHVMRNCLKWKIDGGFNGKCSAAISSVSWDSFANEYYCKS